MQMATVAEKRTIGQSPTQSGGDLVRQATPVLEKVMQIRSGLLVPSPELRDNVKEAVVAYCFDREMPDGVRLHLVRDEYVAVG